MGKHFAPQASSYSDQAYLDRVIGVAKNGGNVDNMVRGLNHHDRQIVQQFVGGSTATRSTKVVDQRAHNILAHLLGES